MRGDGELNHKTPSECRLSKACNSSILGTVLCVKLKLTGFVVRDAELIKRKYLHPHANASTHINYTASTTTAIKTKDIKAKNLGYNRNCMEPIQNTQCINRLSIGRR